MFRKNKIVVPTTDTQELEGIDTWIVSWEKRCGQHIDMFEPCYQAFVNKEKAYAFKKALEDAHKLIGNTRGNRVTIEMQTSGL